MVEIIDLAERRRAREAASRKTNGPHEGCSICASGGMCEPALRQVLCTLLKIDAQGRAQAIERMNERDGEFLVSIGRRFAAGQIEFSPKQCRWLWDIAKRYGVVA